VFSPGSSYGLELLLAPSSVSSPTVCGVPLPCHLSGGGVCGGRPGL